MNTRALLVSGLVFILIASIISAGCTGNSGSSNTTSTSVTTFPPGAPHYAAGDIVKNPKVTAATASLIIGYDPATDSYERAIIYPNADGSWGYRKNAITDKETRAVFEKVYTEKITTKSPSSIPIQTTTIVTTTTSASAGTTTTTTTTTPTNTTTVSPTGKPTFKKIIPDAGLAGTAILVTSLTGTNFKSGATVMLMRDGNPNITATSINVVSATLITCTFTPPANSTAGAWDVVITNPDGQFVRYGYIFSINSPVDTSTTTSSSGDSQGITMITPTFTYGNDATLTITGTNFQSGFTAANSTLTKSTGSSVTITAREVRWDSATQVTVWFTIPSGVNRQRGTYNLYLTMPDGTTRNLQNAFEIR